MILSLEGSCSWPAAIASAPFEWRPMNSNQVTTRRDLLAGGLTILVVPQPVLAQSARQARLSLVHPWLRCWPGRLAAVPQRLPTYPPEWPRWPTDYRSRSRNVFLPALSDGPQGWGHGQ